LTRPGEMEPEPLSGCERCLKAVFGCVRRRGPVHGCRLIHPESKFAFAMQIIIMVSSVCVCACERCRELHDAPDLAT
jgi:hypothetical protein